MMRSLAKLDKDCLQLSLSFLNIVELCSIRRISRYFAFEHVVLALQRKLIIDSDLGSNREFIHKVLSVVAKSCPRLRYISVASHTFSQGELTDVQPLPCYQVSDVVKIMRICSKPLCIRFDWGQLSELCESDALILANELLRTLIQKGGEIRALRSRFECLKVPPSMHAAILRSIAQYCPQLRYFNFHDGNPTVEVQEGLRAVLARCNLITTLVCSTYPKDILTLFCEDMVNLSDLSTTVDLNQYNGKMLTRFVPNLRLLDIHACSIEGARALIHSNLPLQCLSITRSNSAVLTVFGAKNVLPELALLSVLSYDSNDRQNIVSLFAKNKPECKVCIIAHDAVW